MSWVWTIILGAFMAWIIYEKGHSDGVKTVAGTVKPLLQDLHDQIDGRT